VEVDGTDQCELWGDFRAAFMPRVTQLRVDANEDIVVVAAAHDGYRRLDDPVEHKRWFCWIPSDGLVVVDSDRVGPFTLRPLGAGAAPRAIGGAYAPYLGTKTASTVLELAGTIQPEALFGWSLLRPGADVALAGSTLTVRRRHGARARVQLR
jgi:hypothetical protein